MRQAPVLASAADFSADAGQVLPTGVIFLADPKWVAAAPQGLTALITEFLTGIALTA